MKLNNYNPAANEVLFEEVREEKTAGGLYIPSADFILKEQSNFWETEKVVYDGSKSKLGKYRVVKAGIIAGETYKPGDQIVLRSSIQPEEVELDDKTYFQIYSVYIIGYHRE